MKRMVIVFIILTFFATLTGCAGMNRRQQTTLSGAAIGAVGGGLLGAAVGGSALAGAYYRCRRGCAGGYIVGEQGRGYYRGR